MEPRALRAIQQVQGVQISLSPDARWFVAEINGVQIRRESFEALAELIRKLVAARIEEVKQLQVLLAVKRINWDDVVPWPDIVEATLIPGDGWVWQGRDTRVVAGTYMVFRDQHDTRAALAAKTAEAAHLREEYRALQERWIALLHYDELVWPGFPISTATSSVAEHPLGECVARLGDLNVFLAYESRSFFVEIAGERIARKTLQHLLHALGEKHLSALGLSGPVRAISVSQLYHSEPLRMPEAKEIALVPGGNRERWRLVGEEHPLLSFGQKLYPWDDSFWHATQALQRDMVSWLALRSAFVRAAVALLEQTPQVVWPGLAEADAALPLLKPKQRRHVLGGSD